MYVGFELDKMYGYNFHQQIYLFLNQKFQKMFSKIHSYSVIVNSWAHLCMILHGYFGNLLAHLCTILHGYLGNLLAHLCTIPHGYLGNLLAHLCTIPHGYLSKFLPCLCTVLHGCLGVFVLDSPKPG